MIRPTLFVAAAAVACFFLYFYGLGGVGLLSADEPRYAWISRAMAESGDWITPRLWGDPWFEKPALLYWMTGAGFRAGLSDELAVRLPVALYSVAFLIFFWRRISRWFGAEAGLNAALILGTSVGWLSYSQIGVTDLPLAASLGFALLLLLDGSAVAAGVFLGLALLAKGLVGLVLAAPILLFARRDSVRFLAAALATSLPWYLLCWRANGRVFLDEFFLRHHFSRFLSADLQHVQPFWFYLPVMLAGLFPWTPLLSLLKTAWGERTDPRVRALFAWAGFGFLFFSASTNKLPGYLLPILPPVAALIGFSLSKSVERGWLACCAGLAGLSLVIAGLLPGALEDGLSRVPLPGISIPSILMALAGIGFVLYFRRMGVVVVVASVTIGVVYTKARIYPNMDQTLTARQLAKRTLPPDWHCTGKLPRGMRYSLSFYQRTKLPDCP